MKFKNVELLKNELEQLNVDETIIFGSYPKKYKKKNTFTKELNQSFANKNMKRFKLIKQKLKIK